jgi:hypothetical protein
MFEEWFLVGTGESRAIFAKILVAFTLLFFFWEEAEVKFSHPLLADVETKS